MTLLIAVALVTQAALSALLMLWQALPAVALILAIPVLVLVSV